MVSPFAFGLYASQRKESMMFENQEEAIERMYRQFYGNTADPEATGDSACVRGLRFGG